ncbi:MAG: hypothetical protein JW913_07540 [Chitinispirillaceae bacterium]|nr:hypothetical protein [Chitinispirillaceae bacterium]
MVSLLVSLSMIVGCILPDNPQAPEKTSLDILLESSLLERDAFSIEDSVGKQLRIGAVCFLPENIATLTVKVTSLEKEVLLDETIDTFSTEYSFDTVWILIAFLDAGVKNMSIQAVTTFGKVLHKEATVIIHERALPVNHAPLISVTGKLNLQPAEICSLSIRISDSDTGQTLKLEISGRPEGSEMFGDTLFIRHIPADFIGSDTVIFTVTDNGIPPQSALDTAILNVTVEHVNNPP